MRDFEMIIEKRKLRERERDVWYLLQMRVESLRRAKLFRLQNQRKHDYCHHQENKIIDYFYWMGEWVTNLND